MTSLSTISSSPFFSRGEAIANPVGVRMRSGFHLMENTEKLRSRSPLTFPTRARIR
ncbi:MAG: hypothetical protein J7647_02620 [Cyanobacteria bacterium SBLK]|nr:hypothetical protein [Cyanobacteria bacterium SBLK]